MLKSYPDEKMFGAAQKIVEAEGAEFSREDFEVLFEDDSETVETTVEVEVSQVQDVEVKREVRRTEVQAETPKQETKPETQMSTQTSAPQVTEVAAMLAALLASNKSQIDPATVASIANTVFDSKAASMAEMMRDAMEVIANEAIKSVKPREIVIKQTGKDDVKIDGLQHFNFDILLKACSAKHSGHRLNVWLYGPPGTGKTTAAANVAKALGLEFYCTGALQTKYEITGFVDAGGKLIRTPFREAWENGGVYLFDEIDGSSANAIVAFNAALANGIMAFPDKMVSRHPDCVVIAAANTTGMGATAEFNSRMKMDAASIDRFVMLDWPIDEAIEEAFSTNKEWARTVQRVRRNISEKGIKGVFITPRATMYGNSLIESGASMDDVKKMVLRKAMSPEQWAMVA